MQIELSKEELKIIADWGSAFYDPEDEDTDLLIKVQQSILDAEELESLDLNDCGDACKL